MVEINITNFLVIGIMAMIFFALGEVVKAKVVGKKMAAVETAK